jgi:cyclopropane fatty-acyl-phospholipid synthase-like methyltransferase
MSGSTLEIQRYGNRFYERIAARSSSSAQQILQIVYGLGTPGAVLDVGCGRGTWLVVCRALGSALLHGIDGDWLSQEQMLDQSILFRSVDLETTIPRLDRRYDLVISMEIAEHLSEGRADEFVDLLCSAGDIVLFSAAIPFQGGKNHLNERWQSHWAGKFAQRGYECFDAIRPAVWHMPDVEWWYQQNAFLYVNKQAKVLNTERLRQAVRPIVDIVHPANWEQRCK